MAMNKVCGTENDYSPVRRDGGRVAICYGKEAVGDGVHYTWYEVYFYIKKDGMPTFEKAKKAVHDDINAQTDEKILSGWVWNGKPVWLSEENQKNFSEAQRIAVMTEGQSLPVKFKLGEDENGEPVYHTFQSVNVLNQFYLSATAYIQQCLQEGWDRKDSIDWTPYEEALPDEPVVSDSEE